MFIQVIQGQVSDTSGLRAALDRWVDELAPGASGWLGSTAGVTDDGRFVALVRFESEEAARRNSDRPEQDQWWTETFWSSVPSSGPPHVSAFVIMLVRHVSAFVIMLVRRNANARRSSIPASAPPRICGQAPRSALAGCGFTDPPPRGACGHEHQKQRDSEDPRILSTAASAISAPT